MDHILNRLRPRVSPNVKIKSYNVDSQALHKTLNAAIDGNTQIPLEELLPWEQGPVQRVAPSTEHTAEMINTSMGWMTAQELYDHVLGGGSWSRADEGGHAVLDGSLASKAAHKPALPTMGLLSQCCNREKRHLMGTCAPDRPNSFRNRDSSSGSIALEGAPDDASLAKTFKELQKLRSMAPNIMGHLVISDAAVGNSDEEPVRKWNQHQKDVMTHAVVSRLLAAHVKTILFMTKAVFYAQLQSLAACATGTIRVCMVGGVLPIVRFEGLDLSRIGRPGNSGRSSSPGGNSSSSGQNPINFTLIGAAHAVLLSGFTGPMPVFSILAGLAILSATYGCEVDPDLLKELAAKLQQLLQEQKNLSRLPADDGEQEGSSSGSSRRQRAKLVEMDPKQLLQYILALDLASSCDESSVYTILRTLMQHNNWESFGAMLRLHFLLPLALSGGVVASPILGPWVWLRALDAIASGELKKATDIIQELVTQTQERCADQGVNPLTVDPSNDQQLMWFVAACGLQIMKALRSKDPVERARVRAMIKNALMHVAAAPKPLSKPVGGGTRLLVGPLLEEAFSFMERTAFLCWLQFGMDREAELDTLKTVLQQWTGITQAGLMTLQQLEASVSLALDGSRHMALATLQLQRSAFLPVTNETKDIIAASLGKTRDAVFEVDCKPPEEMFVVVDGAGVAIRVRLNNRIGPKYKDVQLTTGWSAVFCALTGHNQCTTVPCTAHDEAFHLAFFTEPAIDNIPAVRVKLLQPAEFSLATKRSLAHKLVGIQQAQPLAAAAVEAEQRAGAGKISDIWLARASSFSEQVHLGKALSKVMTAAKDERPFYGVVVRNSPCNSHDKRLAVPVSFTVSNQHNRRDPDVALSGNLSQLAQALGLTEAGHDIQCVKMYVGPPTAAGYTVLEAWAVSEEEFKRLPEKLTARLRLDRKALDPKSLKEDLLRAVAVAQASPLPVPAGAKHLAHKDCGTRYAPAKLLGVLYPSRHTINDMVSDVLKQPYFHMVALHTDGKVATGVDGKLAVGTVTFGDLARVNPRPSLSAVFHTLMDALETSEDEVFAFSLAPPADGIEARVLYVHKLAGTAEQAAPTPKRQRIGDAGTSSAGGRASNTAGGPGSSSKQALPPKLPQVSTAGNGSRGVSPTIPRLLQSLQQPQQQQPKTPAAAAAAAAVRRATMTAGGGSVTRPNPGPSSSNQGMSWLLDRPVVLPPPAPPRVKPQQQGGAATGSGLCGSSRGKASGGGSSGSSRGGGGGGGGSRGISSRGKGRGKAGTVLSSRNVGSGPLDHLLRGGNQQQQQQQGQMLQQQGLVQLAAGMDVDGDARFAAELAAATAASLQEAAGPLPTAAAAAGATTAIVILDNSSEDDDPMVITDSSSEDDD